MTDDPDADRFSLWSLPGRKSILHDGRRLLLLNRVGRQVLRLAVAPTLGEGAPFAYVTPAGPRVKQRLAAIPRAVAALATRTPPASVEPAPLSLVMHMRRLQALDADRDGISDRAIAALVFGEKAAAEDWSSDGALRSSVRYLLKRGRAYVDIGYRRLLRPDP